MVETIRLESGHTLTGIVGSNPTLSAIFLLIIFPPIISGRLAVLAGYFFASSYDDVRFRVKLTGVAPCFQLPLISVSSLFSVPS